MFYDKKNLKRHQKCKHADESRLFGTRSENSNDGACIRNSAEKSGEVPLGTDQTGVSPDFTATDDDDVGGGNRNPGADSL